ncbi:PP2C family protein-serine/threonine phosphatase [Methylomonas methanica]|uniref:Protein serine/threonine phosphatase n=1 Tax=Methylomonas methanica (strain DSM 25384 / MC09) TaxID=857087 RepID=F9ZV00_METMM|nr:protein phosphatase 2C domain-containing protein [Methylomonas methanica]AEF99433.1 protein serine/threonine phosphatase [Methylomonas methanica MC09]
MMEVVPGNASHIGQRQQQQDAFAFSDFADAEFVAHGGYLAVVADGIGGLLNGAQAANIAVTEMVSRYLAKSTVHAVDHALDQALDMANQAVLDAGHWYNSFREMGTTLVAAVIHQGHLYWRAVGDSHLYLYRDGRLSQLNADHNFARQLQAQVNEGLISQDQADNHPHRLALEYYLGLPYLPEVERNSNPLLLQANDRVLLCSDGIDGVLSADEVIACLAEMPMRAAQRLVDAALEKQQAGQDNLTAVILGYQVQDVAVSKKSKRKFKNPWLIFSA